MANIGFRPAADGSGRMEPVIGIATQPAPQGELSDAEVFGGGDGAATGAPAVAAPATGELSDAEVFGATPAAAPDMLAGNLHNLGLGARAVVHGVPSAVLGLPALGMDAYDGLDNMVRMGFNAVAPHIGQSELPYIPPFRHARSIADVSEMAANAVGLPKPQTKMQEGLTNIASAGIGALGGAGLAGKLGSVLPKIPSLAPNVLETGYKFSQAPSGALPSFLSGLSDAPVLQTMGAAGSVAASEAARANHLPPLAQLGFGMIGALAPGGVTAGAERLGVGGKAAFIDPFTQNGKELIAGNVLNRLAANPTLARQQLGALQPLVPGSLPTLSWSHDPGLIAAEGPMMDALKDAKGGARLAVRQADQNLARNQMLDQITMPGSGPVPEGGQPARGTLEYAQAKRDGAVDENMRPAFGAAQAARQPAALPSSSSLSTPPTPTAAEMAKSSRIERVPLSSARGTQSKMDFAKFNAGEHPGALVKGYEEMPVAVRKENGEYLIFDGHHRTAQAIADGEKDMQMHVIDAKDYAPEFAGRKPAPPTMSDDELLQELGVQPTGKAAAAPDSGRVGYADTKPVIERIDRILGTSVGARKDVQDAMAFAKERLQQPHVDTSDPEVLYSIRKDLQNARDGKYNSDKTNLALAKGELADVIKALDGAIDKAAPGFRRYLELYSKRSRPLNQQQYITDLRARGRTAVTDPVHGEPVLTMGKFGTRVRNDLASGKMGAGVDNANLSEKQIDTLATIAEDIDRGSAKTAGTVKAPGSDTFRNLTVANIIGRVVGNGLEHTPPGKAIQTLTQPISWMYKVPEESIQNVLVEAALDPQLAARLMGNATKYEMENIAKELAHIAMKQGLGATAHNAL